MSSKSIIFAALGALAATPALATPVFFTDRADFQAAAGPLSTESLDAVASEGADVTAQPSGLTFSLVGSANSFELDTDAQYVSEGTGSLLISNFDTDSSLIVDLASPVTAFGIDFLDDGPLPFSLELSVGGATGNFFSAEDRSNLGEGPLFLGVVDAMTPFSTVTITSLSSPETVNFDFAQFGDRSPSSTQVPLPAGGALLLGAVAVLGLHRRRRA